MANLNVFLEERIYFAFKEIKNLCKCRTNEEAMNKIVDIALKELKKKKKNGK